MKKHLISILVLILLLSTSFVGVSNQQEFVDSNTLETPTNGSLQNSAWSMFRHDPNHSGYSTSKAPNINTTLWKYEANWEIADSPSVDNGKVYAVSDDGRIFCLSEDTGELIWDNTIMARTSSPAVVDGKVYIGSFDSKMYCLNASTGTSIWDYPTGGEIRSSPAVVAGKVYIGSWDNKVYCLNASNGAWIWDFTTGDYIDLSSPAVVDGKVYIGSCDNKMYCLNASNGAWIWDYTVSDYYFDVIISSPAVVDGNVYFGSHGGNLYCLNAITGALIWNYTTSACIDSSPAVVAGKVYFNSWDSKMYCLNATTGALIWDYFSGNMTNWWQSSPAVADGKVYYGFCNGNVYCLNAATGVEIWFFTTGDTIWSSPAVADGKVFIGSNDGNLYCFGGYNLPPSPPIITGQTHGRVGIKYNYTFNSTDQNCDYLIYMINWGDGTYSSIMGPSGNETITNHTWSKKGYYSIKAKAKDTMDLESDWGNLSVTMPFSYDIAFQHFWIRVLERFPNAFLILRFLLDFD